MPVRVRVKPVDDLIDEIDAKLRQFKIDYRGLSLRDKVLLLVGLGYDSRCLNVSVVGEHGYSTTAGLDRIRRYLLDNVMVKLNGTEIDVVSGISDYPRRVRELRVEEGYRIYTGASKPDEEFTGLALKPDEYLLVSAEQDVSAARRWHIANRIRKKPGSARDRLLDYFRENVGVVVTTEELSYVSRNKKEFARRIRALRTEDGFAIYTKVTGRPDLNIGEYVLMTLDRVAVAHDRKIKIEDARAVYERDNNKCRACGWVVANYTLADPRILELHHLEAHAAGGANSVKNLVVLCSWCHDEVHAGRCDISHLKND